MLYLVHRLRSYGRFLRMREFDQTTEQGQRDERYRRAILSSLTMFVSRIISVTAGLYTIYAAAPILGTERMAAWYAIISFISIIGSLDLGFPSAIINRVVHARIDGENSLLKSFSVALLTFGFIGFALSVLTALTALILPWRWLLNNAGPQLQSETGYITLLIAPTLFIQIMNTGLTNIFLGLQKAFVANLFTIISSLLSFGTIYLSVHYLPNAAGMIWATQGVTLVSATLMLVRLYQIYPFKWTVPFPVFRTELRAAWEIGRPIFLTSFILILTQNLDVVLASLLLDPKAISELITIQRLFSVFMGAATIMTTPLWAAYSDSLLKRDFYFIKATLLRSFYLNGAMIVMGFLPVIVFSNEIFSLWTSGIIVPDRTLVILSAISGAMGIYYVAFNFYMMGCQILRPQVFTIILFFLSNGVLKYLGAFYFGVHGLVAAALIAFVLTFGLSYGILFRRDVFFWAYVRN